MHLARHEQGPEFVGHTVNMSESGLFVEASELFPVGTEVAMRLPLASDSSIRIKGRVVRADPVAGMGIEFIDLTDGAQHVIREVVQSGDEPNHVAGREALTIWYEGQSQPVRSHAVFCPEGLKISTKLPFLRQSSKVTFRLDGEGRKRQGVLNAVGLEIDPHEGVPKLSITLGLEDQGATGSAKVSPSGGFTYWATSTGKLEAKGNSLEEALVGVAQLGRQSFSAILPASESDGVEAPEGEAGVVSEEESSRFDSQASEQNDADDFDALIDAVDAALSDDPAARAEGGVVRTTLSVGPEAEKVRTVETTVSTSVEVEQEDVYEHEDVDDGEEPRYIGVDGVELSREDVERLINCPELRFLSLRDTRVTDAGLAALSRLRRLRHLDLSGTSISDAGIAQLCSTMGSLEGEESGGTLPLALPPVASSASPEPLAVEPSEESAVEDDDERDEENDGEQELTSGELAAQGATRHPVARSPFIGISLAFVFGVALTMVGEHFIFPSAGSPPTTAAPERSLSGGGEPSVEALQSTGSDSNDDATEVSKSPPPSTIPDERGAVAAGALPVKALEPPATEMPAPAQVLRVVTEGVGQVLVIPVTGSLDSISEYRLVRPFGVAIDLPDADPRVPLGNYLPNEGGFNRVRIALGVAGSETGTHIRVHFAEREPDYRVEVEEGALRVILPR